jgi:hypothetical protein
MKFIVAVAAIAYRIGSHGRSHSELDAQTKPREWQSFEEERSMVEARLATFARIDGRRARSGQTACVGWSSLR